DPRHRGPLPLPEDGDVFTPVVDEAPEPVEELGLEVRARDVRGRLRSGRAPSGRGGVARRLEARELLRERAVSTQEDDPRGHLEGGMILRGEQILPEDEDIATCDALPLLSSRRLARPCASAPPLLSSRRLARPYERLQRGLELLSIGLRLLVQDDEVDLQALHAPVLV